MQFKIVEVSTAQAAHLFIQWPKSFYKDEPNYVAPLDDMVEAIFDPSRNAYFQHGSCQRWLLYQHDQLVGRVAAFVNEKKARITDIVSGGMGFFDCINNQEAANLLFDTCKNWLIERGMEAMDGPINFGENDNFWGLLTDGFQPPSFGMNYHKPYYQALFENYGFKIYYEQVTNVLHFKKNGLPDRFFKIADWVLSKPANQFKSLDLNHLDQFIDDFVYVYNLAWAHHQGFSPMNKANLKKQFLSMKPILIPEFVWFAYVDHEPAGFMAMIPDVNQILKHVNGKLGWVGKLKFAWYRWRKAMTRTRIIVMGINPKYQKLGLESGMIKKCYDEFIKYPQFEDVELSWVGDFNPKMEALHQAAGATFYKRHITYKYPFNPNREFEKPNLLR